MWHACMYFFFSFYTLLLVNSYLSRFFNGVVMVDNSVKLHVHNIKKNAFRVGISKEIRGDVSYENVAFEDRAIGTDSTDRKAILSRRSNNR